MSKETDVKTEAKTESQHTVMKSVERSMSTRESSVASEAKKGCLKK